MNSKNKECLLNFIGFLFLVAQCLSMVEGEVHYYEFVVSTYHIIYSCLFICTDYNSIRVRLDRGVEKWENRKYLVFPLMCLVGG